MKKNNVIFVMILIGMISFVSYKVFFSSAYNKRSLKQNEAKEFVIKANEANNMGYIKGFYDIYNESEEDIEEFGQQIETIYPHGYKALGNFFNGVVMNFKGEGELKYLPASFEKFNGEKFKLINGEYEVGNEIEEGRYEIKFNPKDEEELLEIVISEVQDYKNGSGTKVLSKGEDIEVKLTKESKVKINTYKTIDKWEKIEDGEKVEYEKRLATTSEVNFNKFD